MKNSYEIRGEETAIFVDFKNQTLETLISTDDLERVKEFPKRWSYNSGYIRGELIIKGFIKNIYLHRYIMDTPEGIVVDHINRRPLDNRKINLRNVTTQENSKNMDVEIMRMSRTNKQLYMLNKNT